MTLVRESWHGKVMEDDLFVIFLPLLLYAVGKFFRGLPPTLLTPGLVMVDVQLVFSKLSLMYVE